MAYMPQKHTPDELSIDELKNNSFVDIQAKKLSPIAINLFKMILDNALFHLMEEKGKEQEIKPSEYYNAFNKETQEFDEAKFTNILTLVFNKNKTFRHKNPIVKFFTYRGQKPTKTDFFYLLQDHLCNQQAYRATSNLFLQTALREFIIETRDKLRDIKAEEREAAAIAAENRERRIFSETQQQEAIKLYQYFKTNLAKIKFDCEEAVIHKLYEKYSNRDTFAIIKNSQEDLLIEFTKYQEQRPVLDLFIMLLIAYEQKNTTLFESVIKNPKENEQLQLFSVLLIKRIAQKDIADKAVIYNFITRLILTISKNDNPLVIEEMIKVAISLNQTLFHAGEEKGISNILSALVNKGFPKVAITILKENPEVKTDEDLQLYIKHELTVHYTVRDALLSELLSN